MIGHESVWRRNIGQFDIAFHSWIAGDLCNSEMKYTCDELRMHTAFDSVPNSENLAGTLCETLEEDKSLCNRRATIVGLLIQMESKGLVTEQKPKESIGASRLCRYREFLKTDYWFKDADFETDSKRPSPVEKFWRRVDRLSWGQVADSGENGDQKFRSPEL